MENAIREQLRGLVAASREELIGKAGYVDLLAQLDVVEREFKTAHPDVKVLGNVQAAFCNHPELGSNRGLQPLRGLKPNDGKPDDDLPATRELIEVWNEVVILRKPTP